MRLRRSLFLALIYVESMGNPRAVSSEGALGLCQIMPATGREWAQRLRLGEFDGFNAEQNATIGAAYLVYLLRRYKSEDLALCAYNWGLGNLDKVLGPYEEWIDVCDFAPKKTREYVARVQARSALIESNGGRDPNLPDAAYGLADRAFEKVNKETERTPMKYLLWIVRKIFGSTPLLKLIDGHKTEIGAYLAIAYALVEVVRLGVGVGCPQCGEIADKLKLVLDAVAPWLGTLGVTMLSAGGLDKLAKTKLA